MCKGRGEGWRGEADTGVVGGAWQAGFLADSGEWQVEKKLRKQVAKNQRMLADIFWRSAARRKWVMSSVKSLTRKKIEENSLSAVHHSRLTDNLLSRGWQAIYIQQVVDYMMSNKDIDNSREGGSRKMWWLYLNRCWKLFFNYFSLTLMTNIMKSEGKICEAEFIRT